MDHPHPDKRHILHTYRVFILMAKRRYGTARGLVHYYDLLAVYFQAKKEYFSAKTHLQAKDTSQR